MKARSGFVSNSSSSCFICNFRDQNDKQFSAKEVKRGLKAILECYNKLNRTNLKFGSVFAEPKIADENDVKEVKEYWPTTNEFQFAPEFRAFIGNVLIYSVQDNSIPYELFDLICEHFAAKRIHMG